MGHVEFASPDGPPGIFRIKPQNPCSCELREYGFWDVERSDTDLRDQSECLAGNRQDALSFHDEKDRHESVAHVMIVSGDGSLTARCVSSSLSCFSARRVSSRCFAQMASSSRMLASAFCVRLRVGVHSVDECVSVLQGVLSIVFGVFIWVVLSDGVLIIGHVEDAIRRPRSPPG